MVGLVGSFDVSWFSGVGLLMLLDFLVFFGLVVLLVNVWLRLSYKCEEKHPQRHKEWPTC